MLMGVFFLTDLPRPVRNLGNCHLHDPVDFCFGPKKCCRTVLICSRWSNLSKHHGVRTNGKSWQYELQHRHAETGNR